MHNVRQEVMKMTYIQVANQLNSLLGVIEVISGVSVVILVVATLESFVGDYVKHMNQGQ